MRRINQDIITMLNDGGVGVLPTDTIYGIVGSALNPKTVERIYKLRRRNAKKPMIVLIGSVRDLNLFGIKPSPATTKLLKKFWPGKVSIILPLSIKNRESRAMMKKIRYLHRGTKTLAFRFPSPSWLRRLLAKTGPLVAPSANWEGKPPAHTIKEAKKYFNNKIDFYVNAGRLYSRPSTLIKISRRKVVILRKGAARVE